MIDRRTFVAGIGAAGLLASVRAGADTLPGEGEGDPGGGIPETGTATPTPGDNIDAALEICMDNAASNEASGMWVAGGGFGAAIATAPEPISSAIFAAIGALGAAVWMNSGNTRNSYARARIRRLRKGSNGGDDQDPVELGAEVEEAWGIDFLDWEVPQPFGTKGRTGRNTLQAKVNEAVAEPLRRAALLQQLALVDVELAYGGGTDPKLLWTAAELIKKLAAVNSGLSQQADLRRLLAGSEISKVAQWLDEDPSRAQLGFEDTWDLIGRYEVPGGGGLVSPTLNPRIFAPERVGQSALMTALGDIAFDIGV